MRRKNHLSAWDEAREALDRKDAACPHCAYNLRGNQNGTCPECGQSFDMIAAAFGTVPERDVLAEITGLWSLGLAFLTNIIAAGFVFYGMKGTPGWIYFGCLLALFGLLGAWKFMLAERTGEDHGRTIHTSAFWLLAELFGWVLSQFMRSERWVAGCALFCTAVHCLFGLIVAIH